MLVDVFLSIVGLMGGMAIAGGCFALLVKIGVFTRLMQVTKTKKYVIPLETSIVLGGIVGNVLSVYEIKVNLTAVFLCVFGLFAGMFVGWLHMSLAETLSIFSIVFRRLKLKYGIGCMVLFLALGKLIGCLWFFYNRIGVGL